MSDVIPGYAVSRLLFERSLALIYLIAFCCTANQFVPLLGEHGLLPVPRFVRQIPFAASPSLFYLAPTDRAFRIAAWVGIAVSTGLLIGLLQRWTWVAAVSWATLWLLYLSFVNVGQIFYGFGWESLLLETGFFAIFLGASTTAPSILLLWMWRWVLFRDMFGAGLIKLRGDSCWRDLTCLNYYFETQPIPNALSWYFHWLPTSVHRAGVAFNHVAELGVPFLYFAPQPIAAIAGFITIAFQLSLIVSGNLSWLNWMTIVLCIPTIDDRWLSWVPISSPAIHMPPLVQRVGIYAVAVVVVILSIRPIVNMLSARQLMNFSFNPIHLVNTYGAFGSITRVRNEIVLEGTDEPTITSGTAWHEYEFKGKPGNPALRPPQIAPYHLRLDWLMWFAAMGAPEEQSWFPALIVKLLQGDPATLGLLRSNPFPGRPPRYLRGLYYEYRFTTPEEHRQNGDWWTRKLIGVYFGPATLK
ncbi:MAG TPA: lipase maturation factor family protein [Vicinamibacterales bacterium]